MSRESRSERTARLLAQRLDDLAETLERSSGSTKTVARQLELASVATVHAVRLELLSPDRASVIWDGAKRRHPVLRGHDARLLERYLPRDLAA